VKSVPYALVTALLCACAPAARTPTATTPPPACSSRASAAGVGASIAVCACGAPPRAAVLVVAPCASSARHDPIVEARDVEAAFVAHLAGGASLVLPELTRAGVTCTSRLFAPETASPHAGRVSKSRYDVAAGWLTLRAEPVNSAPDTYDAVPCADAYALHDVDAALPDRLDPVGHPRGGALRRSRRASRAAW
jgi:hypothetical protein